MTRIRVLIVDDSPLARQGVAAILQGDERFEIVGEAADGYAALDLARELMPDLILMDIRMPRCDGLTATRLIKRELPYARIVILSVSDDPVDLFEAIRFGAQGYLLKNMQAEDWLAYLRAVAQGEAPMDRDIAARILKEFAGRAPARVAPGGIERLSPREVEVLQLVADGKTNREIAAALFIAETTVKNHLCNILQKLHLRNRVQLAAFARERGL